MMITIIPNNFIIVWILLMQRLHLEVDFEYHPFIDDSK